MGRDNGFSYIEIVIVVLIISILAVGSYVVYADIQARTFIQAQGEVVVSYMELAREKTGATDNTTTCGTFGGFYSVSLTDMTLSLVPNGCVATTSHLFENVTFPEGNFQVDFDPLGTGFTGPSCIIIQHPRTTDCALITIEGSGLAHSELTENCSCL